MKRYTIFSGWDGPYLEESPDGEVCKYEEVQAKIEELKSDNRALQRHLEGFKSTYGGMRHPLDMD